jgi:hypothetical protein
MGEEDSRFVGEYEIVTPKKEKKKEETNKPQEEEEDKSLQHGGPGSGWTTEDGHVPGSQGGGGEVEWKYHANRETWISSNGDKVWVSALYGKGGGFEKIKVRIKLAGEKKVTGPSESFKTVEDAKKWMERYVKETNKPKEE